MAEIEHFVELGAGETFDLGYTITDLTNGADVFLCRNRFESRDLGFDFLQYVSHKFSVQRLCASLARRP
jgi:hypothetical protein